ncbi:MAG: helix-hairpin-helix domain-containing protein [Proteobacteria bacterium]|nr:helix-hairpin-helix domain-containing protein [Pseudomonadota bacterium]
MLKVKRFDKRLCVTFLIAMMFIAIPLSSFAAQAGPEMKSEVKAPESLIDINTADSMQLSALPGIGGELAERIVAYRNEHGLFKTTQDLEQVQGMGQDKLSQIATLITVKPSDK